MPGAILNFCCECGFTKNDINVGALIDRHYIVCLCFNCNILKSTLITGGSDKKPVFCKKCNKAMLKITEKNAWIPETLNEKFHETEPWMLEEIIFEDDDEEIDNEINDIKILCPKCGRYSLRYEQVGCWD